MLAHQVQAPRALSRRYLSRKAYRKAPAAASKEVRELLSKFADKPHRPLTLGTLLSVGRPVTVESVMESVDYVLDEIPRRLATRVRSLEDLPFIVGTNPYIASTLKAYRDSFLWFATYPRPLDMKENTLFASRLEKLVQDHANDIPTMSKG
jgi:26S proteasome regulatory subunit T1